MLLLILAVIVVALALWVLVKVIDRYQQKTWGDAEGQEPGVRPPPAETKLGYGQNNGPFA